MEMGRRETEPDGIGGVAPVVGMICTSNWSDFSVTLLCKLTTKGTTAVAPLPGELGSGESDLIDKRARAIGNGAAVGGVGGDEAEGTQIEEGIAPRKRAFVERRTAVQDPDHVRHHQAVGGGDGAVGCIIHIRNRAEHGNGLALREVAGTWAESRRRQDGGIGGGYDVGAVVGGGRDGGGGSEIDPFHLAQQIVGEFGDKDGAGRGQEDADGGPSGGIGLVWTEGAIHPSSENGVGATGRAPQTGTDAVNSGGGAGGINAPQRVICKVGHDQLSVGRPSQTSLLIEFGKGGVPSTQPAVEPLAPPPV